MDIKPLEIQQGTLPDDLSIPIRVLDLCPRSVAIDNCVLPIEESSNVVLVAMHDPENIEKIDKLRFFMNRELRILHVDKQVLQRHVESFYNDD